jgi:hypothetical protein
VRETKKSKKGVNTIMARILKTNDGIRQAMESISESIKLLGSVPVSMLGGMEKAYDITEQLKELRNFYADELNSRMKKDGTNR